MIECDLIFGKIQFFPRVHEYKIETFTLQQIYQDGKEKYDLGICMETFEHIPPEMVCDYLKKLSKLIDGHLLITVPNEKGIFFILKRLLKPSKDENGAYEFSLKDYINLILGKTNYVERKEHKGFDYDHLIYDVRKFFNIVRIEGYPRYWFLPLALSFGAGIVAKTKK